MPPDSWFGQQAVYRISMGNFVSALPPRLPADCGRRPACVAHHAAPLRESGLPLACPAFLPHP
jgi:hypothetical protein